ncbi:MAG TPA: ABC transporter permease [Gaiellaceae bacterium]|nr:ABC transporter permease [Gaiellaceae bacterium]
MSTRRRSPTSLFGPDLLETLRLQRAGVVYALILLALALEIITKARGQAGFLTPINVTNVLDQSSLVGFMAVFMTVVLISGNFDLSVASTAALGGSVCVKLIGPWGFYPALLAALLAGIACGVTNGLLVQKLGINAFIVTLGTLTAIRGLVLVITDSRSVQSSSETLFSFEAGRWQLPGWAAISVGVLLVTAGAARLLAGRRTPGAPPLDRLTCALLVFGAAVGLLGLLNDDYLNLTRPTWYMLAAAAVVILALNFTVPGRRLFAVGGNAEAARLSGIRVDLYRIVAFTLMGLAASFVGVIYAGKFGGMNPDALTGTELTVITAAILGGTSLFGGAGAVSKSLVGALILYGLNNGFNVLNVGSTYQYLIQGVIIVAAAAIYTSAGRKRRYGWRRRRTDPVVEPAVEDEEEQVEEGARITA